jgi:TPR repeat protein
VAADHENPSAQLNLGLMYAEGKGVSKDYVRADMWFILAAARNQDIGLQDRGRIEAMMTPAQIVEARHLAAEWRPGTTP